MNSLFSKPLKDATVQDIQLELIRRSSFNSFDGERIIKTLLRHRDIWQAALVDRIHISRPGKLPLSGLIKLRDLDDNLWNADTLYILTPDRNCAHKLVTVAKEDRWGGEEHIFDDPEEVDMALGGAERGQAVVRFWWD